MEWAVPAELNSSPVCFHSAHRLDVGELWWHVRPSVNIGSRHYRPSLLILVSLLNTSADFQWRASASQFHGPSGRGDILGEHISCCYDPSMLLFCWYMMAHLVIHATSISLKSQSSDNLQTWQELAPCFLWTCFVHVAKWAAWGWTGNVGAIKSTLKTAPVSFVSEDTGPHL